MRTGRLLQKETGSQGLNDVLNSSTLPLPQSLCRVQSRLLERGEYDVLLGGDVSVHSCRWNHWKMFFQTENQCVVLSLLQECINGVSNWELKFGFNLCPSLAIH